MSAKLPDLTVEGDVMLKQFDFLVDNKIDKPVKIGRVGDTYMEAATVWCDKSFKQRLNEDFAITEKAPTS